MSNINPQSLARISMAIAADSLAIGVKSPFSMWLPDAANPGSSFEKKITAPAAINMDTHASENFNTGSMGQTVGVDWLSSFPYFWYFTILSGVVYWVGSRNNVMKVMPAATQIGDLDTAPSGTHAQGDVFIAASITPADFAGLPVWGPIGGMPLQRNAASTIPKAVALTAGQDGFGYQDKICATEWIFPKLQNGAQLNYLSLSGAGTTLAFETTTASLMTFRQGNNGRCYLRFGTGTRSAADATSTALYIHLPLAVSSTASISSTYESTASFRKAGGNVGVGNFAPYLGTTYMKILTSVGEALEFGSFDAGDYIKNIALNYQAF